MADLPTNPADAAAASERIMNAANRLETGGIVFLIIVLILGVIAFWLWLRSKKDAKTAENKKLEIEQDGKTKRAELIADSNRSIAKAITDSNELVMRGLQRHGACIESLGKEIHGLRKDMVDHGAKLEHLTTSQAEAFTTSLAAHDRTSAERDNTRERRLDQTFNNLQAVLRELLDRQKGVINVTDSIRIIEECFERSVKPQVFDIVTKSIENNNWKKEAPYITDRVCKDLNSIFFHAERGLANYQLSIDHKLFFASHPDGSYDVVDPIWALIREMLIAASESSDHTDETVERRVGSTRIRVENCINVMLNETKHRTSGIYHDEGSKSMKRSNRQSDDDIPSPHAA
jgi:hypothetical protein